MRFSVRLAEGNPTLTHDKRRLSRARSNISTGQKLPNSSRKEPFTTSMNCATSHVGNCQNDGPFLGPLN